MIPSFIDKEKIPHKPGIYIHRDARGKVIYVGKAIDLYHRVSSYFSGKAQDIKTMQLVSNIRSTDTIVVESEIEALILEANLIKKYLPLYNIRLTDDKEYLYVGITKEDYPRVVTARKHDLKSLKKFFGPFPSSTTVKSTLKSLRRVFPWCSNPLGSRMNKGTLISSLRSEIKLRLGTSGLKGRPCFYYHIGQCPGACIGAISIEDYNKILNRFGKFMDGKKKELLDDLQKEMKGYSGQMRFEEANGIKKIITGIEYLTSPTKITQYLENPNFLEDITRQGLEELQKVLNLSSYPERIECYDISNIQGTDATGSMVVLTNGEIDKSQYRKFKIKISGKPNDYAMHQEMMTRRMGHPEWGIPQLLIIDGGRGQVRAVDKAIELRIKNYESRSNNNNLAMTKFNKIPIYGIAKRFEWLYPPEGDVVKLPKRSYALRLLQKIRDESHRFAITYHRNLRSKSSGIFK